jgi:hypothetical protein
MSISYLSYPVVKNEEESDYYYLLKKDDANCQKDILIKSKISQIYQNEEIKEKNKNRKYDALSSVGRNDNEEINLIITNEKNIQSSDLINNNIKVNDKNEKQQNKNYPFNSSKINNLIKDESKFKYLNKNKIIIDKNNMNENLEENQNVEIEEDKVIKDAFDAYVKEEKERIRKSKQDKFERLKRNAEKEEEIKLKRIEEEAKVKSKKCENGDRDENNKVQRRFINRTRK